MTPFSGIITPESMSFTTPDGKVHNVTSAHENYDAIRETIKELQRNLRAGEQDAADELHHKLAELVDIAKVIQDNGEGRVVVKGGIVYYGDEPVHNAITARILWGLSEGFDMKPYMAFLDNIMENPSKRAADETFGFIEANKMGITEDGHILAYKRVRSDYKDIYTGKMDNSPGKIVEMRRNKVDDNKDRTCSHGLHFCSMGYLPSYGAGPGNTIVIVKVNPRDVVSIPTDYNNAKARCCRYEVIGEYSGDDKNDILGSKAVWTGREFADVDEDYWDGEECPNCGASVEGGFQNFCSECGEELPEYVEPEDREYHDEDDDEDLFDDDGGDATDIDDSEFDHFNEMCETPVIGEGPEDPVLDEIEAEVDALAQGPVVAEPLTVQPDPQMAHLKAVVEQNSGSETLESLVSHRVEEAVREALSGLSKVLSEVEQMRGGDEDAGC